MSDKRALWVWAQQAFGQGSYKPWHIFKRFEGGLEEFLDGGPPLWDTLDFVTEKESRALHAFTLSDAQAVLEFCEKTGGSAITPESEEYPEKLRNIFDPPAVLYYKGRLPDFQGLPSVCIVGSRKAGEDAADRAYGLAYELAVRGCTVISGGAVGIDIAAHRGAMRAKGKTVLVLPCCLSSPYLVENFSLRQKIAEQGGALVTEYPTEMGVGKGVFQIRNRIMSGLSDAVVVVEAAAKSGALITARLALEQDRDVFVCPGENPGDGVKALLEDGAKPIRDAAGVLDEYALRYPCCAEKAKLADLSGSAVGFSASRLRQKPEISTSLNQAESHEDKNEGGDAAPDSDAEKVLAVLEKSPKHVSSIEKSAGLTAAETLSALTELELLGKARACSGGRYALEE